MNETECDNRAVSRVETPQNVLMLVAASLALVVAMAIAATTATAQNVSTRPPETKIEDSGKGKSDAEAKVDEYVETAEETKDGTIQPGGVESKPREQWMTPCPPDKDIATSGDCVPLDEAKPQN